MLFAHKASGFAGLAAGILLVAGLGPVSAMATEATGTMVIAPQDARGDFCVSAGSEPNVVRCECQAPGGVETPPWMQGPDLLQSHIPVLPGQGGKTRLSLK